MIFKKGDKVYDHAYGWGEVVHTNDGQDYPVRVDFLGRKEWYTFEGKICLEDIKPTLSFTEYTLEGFSQVRPKEPLPFRVGDVCYFNDRAYGVWSTDILKTINKEDCLPFITSYSFWKYIALENPLLFPDTRIYTKEDL